MFLHPDLQDARPLMVVGAPRCGTRFVANALNRHPAIVVQGEIPKPAMERAVQFLTRTGEYFASVPQWSASWEHSQRDLLYCIWSAMIKSKQLRRRAKIAWFGHKTPRHDQYWEFYRDFLDLTRPKYVFCIRNFVDHYLSVKAMKESHTMDRIAEEYRLSVNRYAAMKAALGDDISLFILDDLREGGIDYVRVMLFEGLGIEVDDSTLARIDVTRQANSSKGHGRSRRKELSGDEMAFMEENQELMAGLEAARAARPLEPTVDKAASTDDAMIRAVKRFVGRAGSRRNRYESQPDKRRRSERHHG